MKTTKEKIAVMQAFENGKKIEVQMCKYDDWERVAISNPVWNWADYDYRIAPEEVDVHVYRHLTSGVYAVNAYNRANVGDTWEYIGIRKITV